LTVAAYLAIYAGAVIFLVGCLWRIWRYARTPMHLRWELYPVPHEGPYRAAYGGSYFEAQEWWRKPQVNDRWHEWRVMAEEILLLKSLREFNRRLWRPSFAFHFGLYLLIAALCIGTVSGSVSGGIACVLTSAGAGAGSVGCVLIVAGACWLLARRIGDPALKNSTHPADIFNLVMFIAVFGLLAGGYLMRGAGSASLGEFAHGVVHFDCGVKIGVGFGMGVILASALAAYVPFTHMAHFIAKYFAWHSVRWDDRRNEGGGKMQAEMKANLGRKPTWVAEHVGADGKRTWAEVANANPAGEARK
jgi:nitrate reductase gamma subunit